MRRACRARCNRVRADRRASRTRSRRRVRSRAAPICVGIVAADFVDHLHRRRDRKFFGLTPAQHQAERVCRRVAFVATGLAEDRRAFFAVTHVADFGRTSVGAVTDFAAEHETAAETGAAVEIREAVDAGVRPPAPFGERACGGIVMKPSAIPVASAMRSRRRTPCKPGKMHGFGDLSAFHVKRSADGDADAWRAFGATCRRRDDLGDQGVAVVDDRVSAPARDDRAVFESADRPSCWFPRY